MTRKITGRKRGKTGRKRGERGQKKGNTRGENGVNTESKRGENMAKARRKICKHGETNSISTYDVQIDVNL